MAGLPLKVVRFLKRNIETVSQLEVLLLLFRSPSRTWSSREVAKELRLEESSVGRWLLGLQNSGLIKADDDPPNYLYSPKTSDLDKVVTLLASEYESRRLRVIDAILSNIGRMVDFRNAFQIKRLGEE